MQLGVDGGLSGELSVDFNGEEALAHRIDALDQDEAGRRESLDVYQPDPALSHQVSLPVY
jgi:hypothetical protein